jgi:hypothetical protein
VNYIIEQSSNKIQKLNQENKKRKEIEPEEKKVVKKNTFLRITPFSSFQHTQRIQPLSFAPLCLIILSSCALTFATTAKIEF